jgi:hypothetical protein
MTSTPPPSSGGSGYGAAWSSSAGRGVGEGAPGRGRRGASGPDLDPLSNRLLKVAGLLAVALIAVVLNAALHSDGNPLNPVAEAAQRTERAPGMKIAFEFSSSSSDLPRPLVGHGSGAYNARTGRTRMDLSMPIPGHPTLTMRGVGDERTMFLRSPYFAPTLPPGKAWVAMQPLLGHSAETAFGSSGNAKSSLEMLRAAGDSVEERGQVEIRGHLTTLYSGTIDVGGIPRTLEERGERELAREFEQIAKLSPATIPFEVWVDENGIARRLRLVEQLPTTGGQPALTMDMKMEFFDFRARPKIELPPRREAFDLTPMLRAELGMLNGSSFAALTRPSGRAPMAPAAFRRQGNAICRDLQSEAKPVVRAAWALMAKAKRGGELGERSPGQITAQMQQFGRQVYRPLVSLEKGALRRMARLSPPAGDAPDFATLMRQLTVETEERLAEAVAAEAGNLPLWKKLDAKVQAEDESEDRLLRQLGLSACVSHDHGAGHSEASIE